MEKFIKISDINTPNKLDLYQLQPQDKSNMVFIRKIGHGESQKKFINKYKHANNNIFICEYLHNVNDINDKFNVILEFTIENIGIKDTNNIKQHIIYFGFEPVDKIQLNDLCQVKFRLVHVNKDSENINVLYDFDKFDTKISLLETIINKSYKFLI